MSKISDHEYPKARETLERLRSSSYTLQCGKRGIKLVTAGFETLADVLYYECNWEPFEIKLRLKHYEGWSNHDWA